MKDDKFNKLMEQYVSSTKRGQENDLQNLKERTDLIEVKKKKPAIVCSVCAVVLVIVISISIALPLIINKESVPKNYYCDTLNINWITIEKFSDLKDIYQFNCLLPTIDLIDEPYICLMSSKENDEIFGAFSEVSVFDEHFDGITFYVIKKPYILKELQYFDVFTDKISWNGVEVTYQISDYDYDEYYSYNITFSMDSYDYFITFDSYCIMTATQTLDFIYN